MESLVLPLSVAQNRSRSVNQSLNNNKTGSKEDRSKIGRILQRYSTEATRYTQELGRNLDKLSDVNVIAEPNPATARRRADCIGACLLPFGQA